MYAIPDGRRVVGRGERRSLVVAVTCTRIRSTWTPTCSTAGCWPARDREMGQLPWRSRLGTKLRPSCESWRQTPEPAKGAAAQPLHGWARLPSVRRAFAVIPTVLSPAYLCCTQLACAERVPLPAGGDGRPCPGRSATTPSGNFSELTRSFSAAIDAPLSSNSNAPTGTFGLRAADCS
jgi:hypothetical protein